MPGPNQRRKVMARYRVEKMMPAHDLKGHPTLSAPDNRLVQLTADSMAGTTPSWTTTAAFSDIAVHDRPQLDRVREALNAAPHLVMGLREHMGEERPRWTVYPERPG